MGWYKYVGHNGTVIGLDRFGASAPGPIALEKLGISVSHVVEAAKKLLKSKQTKSFVVAFGIKRRASALRKRDRDSGALAPGLPSEAAIKDFRKS